MILRAGDPATPENVPIRQKQARRYACRIGHVDQADDFSSYVAEHALRGGVLRRFEDDWIDFQRVEHGQIRSEKGKAKALARHVPVVESPSPEQPGMQVPGDLGHLEVENRDFFDLLRTYELEPGDHALLVMTELVGMDMKDVGRVFGRSEAWVSYRRTALFKAIRERAGGAAQPAF
jgi:hypothetical protein